MISPPYGLGSLTSQCLAMGLRGLVPVPILSPNYTSICTTPQSKEKRYSESLAERNQRDIENIPREPIPGRFPGIDKSVAQCIRNLRDSMFPP